MSEGIQNSFVKGHVFYVEPNDGGIGKDQDGGDVSLMPHLEDLSIGVVLTAEVHPRDGLNNIPTQASLSWISHYQNKNNSTSEHIINSGTKMGKENYLTTFYTEISADSYIEKEMVEGFGVTNVSISFESWYTPTITINFVDVHGAALWGREEAIHSNGNLTGQNILGVFFTQPYPLFRLQVKGFLGREVTYQLSVSSFKGKYNSQTGNFEATATFIGYSYSLLSDIPLKLIVSAPYMEGIGRTHWNENAGSKRWKLFSTEGMDIMNIPTLRDVIARIKDGVGSPDSERVLACSGPTATTTPTAHRLYQLDIESLSNTVSIVEGVKKDDLKTVQGALKKLEDAYQKYVKQINSDFEDANNKGVQVSLLQGNSWNYSISGLQKGQVFNFKLKDKYTSLQKTLTDANNALSRINTYLEINISGGSIFNTDVLMGNTTTVKIQENQYQDGFSLGSLINRIKSITIHTLETSLTNKNVEETNERINYYKNQSITQILGFEPTIGNFVKLVMCHLETFVNIILGCSDKIYEDITKNNGRKRKYYCPNNKGSDNVGNNNNINREDVMWPWPGLYRPYTFNNQTNTHTKYSTLGWPGDYPPINGGKWEERELVVNFMKSVHGDESITSVLHEEYPYTTSYIPICPSDFVNQQNPFENLENIKTSGDLAPYLGLRIALICGFFYKQLDDDKIEELGQIDASNFILSQTNYNLLQTLINENQDSSAFINNVTSFLLGKSFNRTTEDNMQYNSYYTISNNPMYSLKEEGNYEYSLLQGYDNNTIIIPYNFVNFDEWSKEYSNIKSNGEKAIKVEFDTTKEQWGVVCNDMAYIITNKFNPFEGLCFIEDDTIKSREYFDDIIRLLTTGIYGGLYRKDYDDNHVFSNNIWLFLHTNNEYVKNNRVSIRAFDTQLKITPLITTDEDVTTIEDIIYNKVEYYFPYVPVIENGCIINLFLSKHYNSLDSSGKAILFLMAIEAMVGSQGHMNDFLSRKGILSPMPPYALYLIGGIMWNGYTSRTLNVNVTVDKDSKESSCLVLDYEKEKYSSIKVEQWGINCGDINESIGAQLSKYFLKFRDTIFQKYFNYSISEQVVNEIQEIMQNKTTELYNLNAIGLHEDTLKTIPNIYDKISKNADGRGFLLWFKQDGTIQNILMNLCGYQGDCFVTHIEPNIPQNNKISKISFNSYLKGFFEELKNGYNYIQQKLKRTYNSEEYITERDEMVSIYYAIKHLWDTWLITANKDQFTIENFFEKCFVFIDTFYVNIYSSLKLNAEHILEAFNTKDINLLTFITYVTSHNGCMFLSVPSFCDTNLKISQEQINNKENNVYYKDNSWTIEDVKNIFMPIPFNDMLPPHPQNTFVFVYTHAFAQNASEMGNKKWDSFTLTNFGEWPDVLKINNNNNNIEGPSVYTRQAYMLPSFGVAVNRGNNHIFKSINVNMDTPQITAVAAQTWEDILTKTGADGAKRVFFHGQDIYSIYAQYTYACEIEMLGCAQIQPLMYFQLLNIPMWRGTYMIYKVTHTLKPGDMVTKFTGMKLSRYRTPFAESYFNIGKKFVLKQQ